MDLKAILEKYFSEALAEDAKLEIETLFEAAVKDAVEAKVQESETALEEKYSDELKEFKSDLVEKLNDYLEVTFKEWFDENTPAMVSDIKVTMAESIMGNLKSVLSDNFVEIKEEEVDVVKDLETQLADAKERLDEAGNDQIEMRKQILEFEKAIAFTQMTEGMALTDKESLLNLVEDISAEDVETFKKKAAILKDKLSEASSTSEKEQEEKLEEEKETENPDEKLSESANDSELDRYLPKGF